MDDKKIESFPILKDLYLDEKYIENKKNIEKIVFTHMINIYCKKENHKGREILNGEDKKFIEKNIDGRNRNMNLSLCPKCLDILKYSFEKTDKCIHIGYKTFCNRCPTPCYKEEYRGNVIKVMKSTRKIIFLKHPIITFKHLKSTLEGINLSKKHI